MSVQNKARVWCPPYVPGQGATLSKLPPEMKAEIVAQLHESGYSVAALSTVDCAFRAACWRLKFQSIKITGKESRARRIIDEMFALENEAPFFSTIRSIRIITEVDFCYQHEGPQLGKAEFKLLTSTPGLEHLTIRHVPFTPDDSAMPILRSYFIDTKTKMPSVKKLTFHDPTHVDFILEACPNLETASLAVGGRMKPLRALAGLRSLHTVNLTTRFGDWGGYDMVDALPQTVPQVTNLALQGNFDLNWLDVSIFRSANMPSLREVAFSCNENFWEDGPSVISQANVEYHGMGLVSRRTPITTVCWLSGLDLAYITCRRDKPTDGSPLGEARACDEPGCCDAPEWLQGLGGDGS